MDYFIPTPKQKEFQEAILSGKYTNLLFGGAIRGGKSAVGISSIIALCRIFPGSRWGIVRKDLPTIKRNVWPIFNKIAPPKFIEQFNKGDMFVRFKNKSEILFIPESIKDDPELNRWRGLEVNGFLGEEINELQYQTFLKMNERAGTWFMDPMPPVLVLATCNPTQEWPKRIFYDPWAKGELKPPFYYLQARVYDNPYVPQSVIENWKATMPPDVYARFVDGDWSISEHPRQLIKFDAITRCEGYITLSKEDREFADVGYMGVDVGRQGGDPNVWVILKGGNLVFRHSEQIDSLNDVAEYTMKLIADHRLEAENVWVDTVGIGAGVYDILHAKGIHVSSFVGGGKLSGINVSEVLIPYNLRAEAYWALRDSIENVEIGNISDIDLISDLVSIQYKEHGDKKFIIETKEEIRKRLGRSPNDADALMMANYGRLVGNGSILFSYISAER